MKLIILQALRHKFFDGQLANGFHIALPQELPGSTIVRSGRAQTYVPPLPQGLLGIHCPAQDLSGF